MISLSFFTKGFGENFGMQLILLQNANGSWELDEDLTKILGTSLEDIKAANPVKVRCKVVSLCVLHDGRIMIKIEMNKGQAKK